MLGISEYVFTWRSTWISAFESPWSILEKFKLANHINNLELFRFFGTEKVMKAQVFKETHFELIKLSSFDTERTKIALGYDIVNENKKNLNQIIGVLPNKHLREIKKGWESVYLREKLFYCPKCLENGYHSLFHQFKLLHKCPIHDIPLNNCCPNCGMEHYYLLSNKTFDSPFTCLCGYQYCNVDEPLFFNNWKQYKEIDFILPESKHWLHLNFDQKERLKKMYFIPEINFDEYNNSIKIYLSLLGYEYLRPNSLTSRKDIKEIKGFEEKKEDRQISKKGKYKYINQTYIRKEKFDKFQKDFYMNYKQIVAALSKKIRNTVLLEHKACLKSLKNIKKSSGNDSICPYAYAYIAWRRSIQNFTDFTEVDHFGRPNRLNPSNIELPPYMPFLYDLFILWQDQFEEDITKTSRASTKWLLNRVTTHLLWYQFKNWLRISEKYIQKKLMPSIPPFGYEHVPFFILVFSEKSKERLEFHWWENVSKEFIKPVCNQSGFS